MHRTRMCQSGKRVAVFVAASFSCSVAVGATPDVALPPQTQSAQVAKRIVYNGLDMHANVFESGLSQQQVVDFYRRKWGKKTSINDVGSSKVVGHLDGDFFITVQVTSDGEGSKGTIGVVRLPPEATPRPELGKGLPQPFGTKVVNDISYPDDRTPARTVLMVDGLSPNQNADWFRSRLIAKGWTDAGANDCRRGAGYCVLQFERGKTKMMFVAQRTETADRSQILMNILNPEGD